jgi:3,4-dihydroxy-2-butanone 4-phosphate synthase
VVVSDKEREKERDLVVDNDTINAIEISSPMIHVEF